MYKLFASLSKVGENESTHSEQRLTPNVNEFLEQFTRCRYAN